MLNKTPKASEENATESVHKPKKRLLLGVLMLAVGGWLIFDGARDLRTGCDMQLGNQCLKLEQATTPTEREQGLSGRESLPASSGLLFVFEQPALQCFWMKDMKFAIDMVWLDEAKKVVHIKENAAPESYPESFCPDQPSKYVLEVSAGQAEKAGVKVGDTLRF